MSNSSETAGRFYHFLHDTRKCAPVLELDPFSIHSRHDGFAVYLLDGERNHAAVKSSAIRKDS